MIPDENNAIVSTPAQDENIAKIYKKIRNLSILTYILFFLFIVISGCVFYLAQKINTGEKNIFSLFPSSQKNDANKSTASQTKGIDTSQLAGVSTSFEAPYPVVWEDTDFTPNFGGAGKFSLTSAYVGNFQITDDILKTLWNGFDNQGYSAGQNINAVVLGFKINVKSGGTLPSAIRRIETDSTGSEDKFPPLNRDYIYEGHKPMNDFVQSDSTIENAKVIFAAPQDKSEFVFTTGGANPIKFTLLVKDGKIEIAKEEAQTSEEKPAVPCPDNSWCEYTP